MLASWCPQFWYRSQRPVPTGTVASTQPAWSGRLTKSTNLLAVVQNGRLCMLTSSADDIRGAVLGATPTGVFVEPQVQAMISVQNAAISWIGACMI